MSWLTASLKSMFMATRYDDVKVLGFDYRVVPADADLESKTAYKLHDLNERSIEIISFIRRYLAAADEGRLSADDQAAIPTEQLRTIYNRLVDRYDPDSVYESQREGEDTSYVVDQGMEMAMCVRVEGDFERDTVLTSVLTHELAHIASATPLHDGEFWSNYDVLQKITAQLGYVSVQDISMDGETHCQRVHISYTELSEVAVGGPNAKYRHKKGGYKATELHQSLPRRGRAATNSKYFSVPDYLLDYHNALENFSNRYEPVKFDPSFPALRRYAPPGFSEDHPMKMGYKEISPITGGRSGMLGRVERMSDTPNPIAVEFYSHY